MFKRCIGIIVSLLLLTNMLTVFADNRGENETDEIIYEYFNAINEQNWDAVIQLSADSEDMATFISNATEKVGILTTEDVDVKSLVQVSPENSINYNSNYDNFGDLQVGYLIGLDTKVSDETKYFYDGFNLYLLILVQTEGNWGVLEFSQATPDLIKATYTTRTRSSDPNIDKVLDALEKRKHGIFTNLDGDVLEENIATEEQLIEENGGKQRNTTRIKGNQFDRPDTLRVYLNAGYPVNVSYYDWTKVVLFQGFGANFIYKNDVYGAYLGQGLPMASLEAGAQAVKARGWYGFHFPLHASKGADVSSSSYGNYFIGAATHDRCTQAINNVSGILPASSDWNVFPAQWADSTHTWTTQGKGTGQMYQSGTWYWGLNNRTWQDVVHYYYGYSKWSSGAIIMLYY